MSDGSFADNESEEHPLLNDQVSTTVIYGEQDVDNNEDVDNEETPLLLNDQISTTAVYGGPNNEGNEGNEDDNEFTVNIETALTTVGDGVKNVWFEFRDFVDQRNVLDLAVAIAIGNNITSIVNSFINDIFAPIFGIIVPAKLSELFLVIRKGPHFPYKTRDEARKDGAVTWNYGIFFQLCLDFALMIVILFVIMRMVQILRQKKIDSETTKECPICFSDIDGRAKKCSACTADL